MTLIVEAYRRADALVFGGRTYEGFASYRGTKDPRSHPIAAP